MMECPNCKYKMEKRQREEINYLYCPICGFDTRWDGETADESLNLECPRCKQRMGRIWLYTRDTGKKVGHTWQCYKWGCGYNPFVESTKSSGFQTIGSLRRTQLDNFKVWKKAGESK